MKIVSIARTGVFLAPALLLCASTAFAHKLRGKGEAVTVADSALRVTPARDWNCLDLNLGKNAEFWTLDGTQLNTVTFFAGVQSGKPLFKEKDKKTEPLPKFGGSTLVVEIPELLETTYRTYKGLAAFQTRSVEPKRFLGNDGVSFSYQFTDEDQITRNGEAVATIIKGKLYMMTFDAPRLHYYDKSVEDFRSMVSTAAL